MAATARGHIEELPSGSFRVHVYAGTDPVTGKRRRIKPMKPATILRIHSIISSALDLAVRYDWVSRNVARNASPPNPRKREPNPPTPEQAARLLNVVFAEDEEFRAPISA